MQTYILGWTYPKLDCADVTAAHLAAITAIAPKKAFPRLRAGDLAGLTNVRWLELNWKSRVELPAGIFDDLVNLKDMNLVLGGDGTPNKVPGGLFDKLANLNSMILASSELPEGALDKLTNLTDLHFMSSGFTELPDGVFDKLTGLTYITLANNFLTELPEGVFDKQANLKTMILYAPMTELPDGIFDKLINLKSLYFRRAEMAKLPDGVFDNLANLSRLDFSAPALTELPDGVFRKLTGLRKLEFYGPALTELPDGIFARNAGAVDLLELSFRYHRDDDSGRILSDVEMTPQFARTDADNFAPGPASVVLSLPQGAPRTLNWALSAEGASLSTDTVTVPAGATISAPFTLTRNEDHSGDVTLRAEKTWNFGDIRGVWFPDDNPEIRLFPRADMPQNLRVAAADGSLKAIWNKPADDRRLFGYTVRWKLATAETFAADDTHTINSTFPSEKSYTIKKLQNGLAYDVEVAAQLATSRGSLVPSDFVRAQGVPQPVKSCIPEKSQFRLNVLGGDLPSARDGTAIMRYLLGVRGKSLIAGLSKEDPCLVESRIEKGESTGELDVDKSGQADSTDGALIARYLLGLRGDALIADLKVASEAKDIAKNIEELKPASAS